MAKRTNPCSATTRIHPLATLDFPQRVRKRAEYEAFTFSLIPDGVLVRNESYADPASHEYVVQVTDGIPVACDCPADANFAGACKHRVAVAMRRPILDAVSRMQAVSADRIPPSDQGTFEQTPEEA
jgi:hypothetical protein